MASAPSEPRPILGRVDRAGRLIAADAELATLQMEAGSSIGATLALPQVAAVARLARKLGIPVSRPAVAAGSNQDIDLWVRAVPEGDEIALTLEGWTVRPAAPPRLAALLGGDSGPQAVAENGEWATDADMKLTSVSAHWIKNSPPDEVAKHAHPFFLEAEIESRDEAKQIRVCAALKERATTLVELATKAKIFYGHGVVIDSAAGAKHLTEEGKAVLAQVRQALATTEWNVAALDAVVKTLSESLKVGMGKIAQPVRVAVTGRSVGPPLFESLELLGREASLDRLTVARDRLTG